MEITSCLKKDASEHYRDTKGHKDKNHSGPKDRSHTPSGFKKTPVAYLVVPYCLLSVMDLSNHVVWNLTKNQESGVWSQACPTRAIFSESLPLSGPRVLIY